MRAAPAVLLVLLGPATALSVFAQPSPGQKGQADAHAVVNFADLARQEADHAPPKPPPRRIPFLPGPPPLPVAPSAGPPSQTPAPAQEAALPAPRAMTVPAAQSPSTSSSFIGGTDNNTAIPPDTNGAAGPNHLMVTINNGVWIQNRTTGATISNVSLNAFWASTGATGVFDPHVIYDPYNSRWITTAVSDGHSASSSILIGVSQTSDPTGIWNLYRVDADSGNTLWADYPSLGFNKNWIVVTVNLFANSNDAYNYPSIFAFNKANLYAGSGGTFTRFNDTSASFTQMPALTFDNTLATEYLLENYNPNAGGFGYIRVSTITGPVGSEVYTLGPASCCTIPGLVRTANPWSSSAAGGADFAPQLGATTKIDAGDDRFLTFTYRNGSLWAAQNAFLPAGGSPTRVAAQWWQFNTSGTVQQFGRVDDGTGATFYAYPTLAVNKNNDVLLGYSQFSATTYAAAGYSYRSSGDAANTMQSGVVLKAGENPYSKGAACWGNGPNRWGDYSNTVVDPVNDVDLWTIQEYASSPNFGPGPCSSDGRWGTWWGKIAPVPVIGTAPSVYNFGNQRVGSSSASVSISVTNTGNTTLTVSTVTFTGANTGDFSKTADNCTLASVIPSASCTINVNFTPTATGARSASLIISSNDPVNPTKVVPLSGIGTIPDLSITKTHSGSFTQGQAGAAYTITVSNAGSAATSGTVTVTDTLPAAGLTATAISGTGWTCTLATLICTRADALAISTSYPAITLTVNVAGNAAASVTNSATVSGGGESNTANDTASDPTTITVLSAVSLSPISVNFGNQAVSVSSAPQMVTVTNTGTTSLTVTNTAASGDFSQTNNCATVAVSASCTITVTFAPTTSGLRAGAITITDNASDSPQQIRLFGTGTSGAPVGAKVRLSSNALNFGSQTVNTTVTKTVTLTNSGDSTLTLNNIFAAGSNFFSQNNNCGLSVPLSASCNINVIFAPTSTGNFLGAITIVDNASGSPQVIRLFGLGTSGPAPAIGFSSVSLNFGNQANGVASAAKTVTVTNTGTTTLNITAVATTGNFAASGCVTPLTLSPAAACTLSITFTPTATGTRRGSVAVTDDASGSPQVIRLFGKGT